MSFAKAAPWTASLPQAAFYSGIAAIATGLAVLVGWHGDVESLKRILPGLVSMNPLTAVAFILAGGSLALQSDPKSTYSPWRRRIAHGLGWIIAALGLIKLGSYAGWWDLRLDQLLFTAKLEADGGVIPNRMAPNTALCFMFLGVTLALIARASPRSVRVGQGTALALTLISLLAVVGYAYEVRWLYGVAAFIPMALHTAILFHLLALGTLAARPHAGMMALFTSESPGGALVRRLLPGMVTIFVMVGWLRLEGEKRGYYGTELGVAIFTLSSITLVGALICLAGRSLHQADIARRREEAERERFFSLSLDLLAIAGMDGYFKRVSPAFTATLGYDSRTILTKPWPELVHPEDLQATESELSAMTVGAPAIHLENRIRCADGSWRWISWKVQLAEEGLLYATGHDVSEERATAEAIKTLNQDLSVRATQLEEANRELEAFSYSVSHDLRAPLRHIQGYAEMLASITQGQLSEKAERYLKTISQAGEEMGRLIDDLLAFSRMGRSELRPDRVTVATLLQDTINGLEMLTKGRNITWTISPMPDVLGDPAMLRQVLANLVGNALKYTRRKEVPQIEVGCSGTEHGFASFFVRDNGAGFDMRYVHKLFGVFQRLHRSDEFEGTGIGLAIVRRVIARHGGRVWAEGALDQGATFYFTLKLAADSSLPPTP